MTIDTKSYTKTGCQCSKIPVIVHELNQSLAVMRAYLMGCIKRRTDKELEPDQLAEPLDKINQHIEIISNKIKSMINTKDNFL